MSLHGHGEQIQTLHRASVCRREPKRQLGFCGRTAKSEIDDTHANTNKAARIRLDHARHVRPEIATPVVAAGKLE
jgi:hypothetical protein